MRPTRVLWTLVLVSLAATLATPTTRRGLTPRFLYAALLGPRVEPDVQVRAARLNTVAAWAACAEELKLGSDEQTCAFDRAVALDPRDEPALVRRAGCLVATAERHPARAASAVAALLAAWPDNAYGHYLQAALLAGAGRRDEAVTALQRGHAAPRFDVAWRATSERVARLTGRWGQSEWDDRLADADLRELRRLANRLRPATCDRAALETALAVARLGHRLRDEGDLLVTARLGVAIECIAFAAGEPPLTRSLADDEWEPLWRSRARLFDAKLAAVGGLAPAGWAVRESRRSLLVRRRLLAESGDWVVAGGAALHWHFAAYALHLAALAALLAAGLATAGTGPLRWADLARLTLGPWALGLAYTAVCVRQTLGRGPSAVLALPALLLPVLAAWLTVVALRRRGVWREVSGALAALLLLSALATSVPAGWHERAFLASAVYEREQVVLQQARR